MNPTQPPLCGECPLSDGCLAYERNTVLQRPVKQPKKAALPVEVGFSIALRKEQNGPLQWWVERRPDSGIWSQLEAFPCRMTPQRLGEEADINIGLFGNQSPERQMFGPVKHILTHRRMTAWFSIEPHFSPPKTGGPFCCKKWTNPTDHLFRHCHETMKFSIRKKTTKRKKINSLKRLKEWVMSRT